jgi:alpha-amylase
VGLFSIGTARSQATSFLTRDWKDEIIYVIVIQKWFDGNPANDYMLGRFGADKSRFEGGLWGGDLDGITQKLDYLSSLGVSSLLLYPVVANDTKPLGKFLTIGYRPRDYFQVDENFGDLASLKRLVDGAHERKMRVILDLPLGFPGIEHPYYHDPSKSDWFGRMTGYGVRQWNTENPQVADYLIKVSKFWKEQTQCDGFRLDSVQLHPAAFWERYVREVKGPEAGSNFFLLAELPLHPSKIGQFIKATGFDSAYDFSAGIVREVFGKDADVNRISFVLREGNQYYPDPSRLCAQIDQYEDPEFITAAKEPKEPRMRMAMTYLLTLNRIPLLYSGDEVAASYREVGGLFTPARQSSPFLEFTRKLIALRKNGFALRRADLIEVQSSNPIYAYLRTAGDDRILVIFNNSREQHLVRFPLGTKQWKDCDLYDLLRARSVKPRANAEPIAIEPFGAMVLRVSQ